MNKKKLFTKKILSAILALAMVITSVRAFNFADNKVSGASTFPSTGVHKGTLTHGKYSRLTALYRSTGANIIEPDTMNSEGDSRTCFCLSAGISETTKKNAYTSSNYTSGYSVKYFKSLMQFYYDNKDKYKENAIRYATGMWVWRTVDLEKNSKGNFVASDFNKSGFKTGFIESMKSIFGYSSDTATKIYEKAYNYIKDGATDKYNSSWSLLKWTATKSQTMLTGKPVPAPKSVEIKINKDLDISGTGISLSGTQYTIRKDSKNGSKVATYTLNKDGVDTVKLSQKGNYDNKVKYVIYETKNVAGTLSNESKAAIEFSIDWSKVTGDGGLIYIKKDGLDKSKGWFIKGSDFNDNCKKQLINNIPHTTVQVTKKSERNNANLKGAEFTIYAYNKNTGKYTTKVTASNNNGISIVNPLVTGTDGKAISGELYYTKDNQGKFLIQETKAPTNYVNARESKLINIPNGNGIKSVPTLSYTFKDEEKPRYAELIVEKIDEATGEPIFDAEFSVYSLKDNKGKYHSLSEPDINDYDLTYVEPVKMEQIKDDTTGKLTNTFKLKNLVSGRTYRLTETKRPTGFMTNRVQVLGGGAANVLNTVADVDQRGLTYNAFFEVTQENKIKFVNDYNYEIGTIETGEAWTVSNDTIKGKLKIVKTDEDDSSKKLQGASFEIWQVSKDEYNTSGYIPNADNGDTLIGSDITDVNGEIEFSNIKGEFYYMVIETKAPEGYILPDDNIKKFYVPANECNVNMGPDEFFNKTLNVTNKKAYVDLNIHKISTSRTGKESIALPGAKFALYKVEKIVTDDEALADYQLEQDDSNNNGIDNTTEDVISDDTEITNTDDNDGKLSNMNYIGFDYSKLTPVEDGITTDANGDATVSQKLEAGGYVLVETEAPRNYRIADPQYIYIDTEKLYSFTPYEIEVKDEEFEAEVKVTKHDKVTGKVIKQAGVGFKIKDLSTNEYIKQTVDTYAAPEVEGAPHDLIKSEKTDTFYTDETGSVTLPNVLPVGKYQMEEAIPPNGYTLDLQPVPFEINEDMVVKDIDENTREVVVPVKSNDLPTNVEITKAKLSDQSELEGAKLKVEDESGKTVDEWVSKKEPHTISGLSIGKTYTLIETKPADGYVTAEKISFTIKDTNDVQKVVMYDDVTKVKITKSDITTGEPVVGAKLEIIDKDGNIYDSWTTTKDEHYIEQIPVGTYKLKETLAPGSYVTNEITFTVKDTGKIQKIDMKDDYTKVRLIKVDKTNNSKKLEGAEFDVSDSSGKKITTVKTNKNGVADIVKLLEAGKTYTFTEKKAPEGYLKAKSVKYKVKNTAAIQKLTIEDQPITPDTPNTPNTPKTGNIISLWQYIIGIGIGIILLFVLLKKRKKVPAKK